MREQRPRHFLVTGGTGYVGSRFVQVALSSGAWVTLLSRGESSVPAHDRIRRMPWKLGDPVPREAFQPFAGGPTPTALVHFAHFWTTQGSEAADPNLDGTLRLLESSRSREVPRFVYASSVAARPDALNRYGRVKHAVESMLNGINEVAARIGVVYGGPEKALWGTLCRVVGLSPILPMIGTARPVQPIHVDEVANGVLRLADGEARSARPAYVLAGPPVAFGAFLKAIARHRLKKGLLLIPLPIGLALMVADLVNLVPGISVDRERILGLAGVPVRDAGDDLEALGLSPRSLDIGLEDRN